MADRYVNYDKLLEERHRLGLDEMSKIHKVNAFNHFIDNLPTVDVVEVVRCKDCKYYSPDNKSGLLHSPCNRVFALGVCHEDSFCSYGERRDNNG